MEHERLLHETFQILARTDEIDDLLDRDLDVPTRLQLQEELFGLRQRIETLRHFTLGVPLAAICDA